MLKNTLTAFGLRWSKRKDRGATAVVIGLTLLLVMGAAAISFDTANLALQRQTLRNITDAAAQAGASYLPDDPTGARSAALAYAQKYDTTFTPAVSLWCMVGSTGATKQVASGHIPATCNPGGSGVYVNGVGGVVCDEYMCAVPCSGAVGTRCNTMKVDAQKNVPFYFAPAIGIDNGTTGAVSSVSCRGACGTLMPNAMDIAFVADRTTSMSASDFATMRTGISDSLKSMTPEYQFVTLGTIHKSVTSGTCKTNVNAYSTNPTADNLARTGSWMPLDFSNNYLTGSLGSTGRTLNATSDLVSNITCMNQKTQPWGTHLAAPLKAAALKLLTPAASNLAALTAARSSLLPTGSTVKKAIIMETDGVPEESIGFNGKLTTNSTPFYTASNKALGSTSLSDNTDPVSGSPWNGELGCTKLKEVANNAKAAGITVIMIGYGIANSAKCNRDYNGGPYTGSNVDDVLAAAASKTPGGTASTANNNCTTTAGATAENNDGDFYFCAATASQLSSIFATAVSQISSTTKFVKMPV